MNVAADPMIAVLDDLVRVNPAVVHGALRRVLDELASSAQQMAWEIVPLEVFGDTLPESIRSCWVFGIRAGAETGAERHPNSHQRSLSLTGTGRFELQGVQAADWIAHVLVSEPERARKRRWVSIAPATWHRLFADEEAWGMVSFHTVAPQELIEERPVDPEDLSGPTRRKAYAGRR